MPIIPSFGELFKVFLRKGGGYSEQMLQIYTIDESIKLINDKIGIIKHIQADRVEQIRPPRICIV